MRWGHFVSVHPYLVISLSLLITAISSLGFLSFKMEHKANQLWIPVNSSYNSNKAWLDLNFKKSIRTEMVIMRADNILTPHAMHKMLEVYQRVNNITVEGKMFPDLCTRVPIADIFQTKKRRRRRNARDSFDSITKSLSYSADDEDDDYIDDIWDDEYYDYSDDETIVTTVDRINFEKYGSKDVTNETETLSQLPKSIYCDLVTTLNEKCAVHNLLEMWRFSPSLISTTTTQEIVDAVNKLQTSPWFGHQADFSQLLGGIRRNSSGHIVSAEAVRMFWSIKVPEDAEIVESQGSGVELELGDATSLAWEEEFIKVISEESSGDFEIIPNAVKSYGAVSSEAIFFDGTLMVCGYLLMFLYTSVMLGKLNCVEHRMVLSIAGICSIMMGLVIAVGLSSLLGFPYTPMHAILPFLCLGIGIDDMFVIVQCLNNKKDSDPLLPIPSLLGATLQHAGVSITVTSLTDVLAFGVGAVTAMPGLQSFCVCTALGLASIYTLQLGWFVAWLALDEQRIQEERNGFAPCVRHHKNRTEDSQEQETGSRWYLMSWYRSLLSSSLSKVVIVTISLCCLAVGVWGATLIRHKFNPLLLLPSQSYLSHFIAVNDEYFSSYTAWSAEVYTGSFNHSDLARLDSLVTNLHTLKEQQLYIQDYNCWWTHFNTFIQHKTNFSSWKDIDNPEDFPIVLSDFLFSVHGSRFKINFQFSEELLCNKPAPNILATKFDIKYFPFDGPEEHVPAKDHIDYLISQSGLQDAFSFVKIYAAWETDRIIGFELWRNMGLAILCVFIITLILLANLKICLMVLGIVILTLTDIVGFLHFWSITIDIISCINIVIAIGLCVDYSVHIAHAYMLAKGSSVERAMRSVELIGPAVANGGFTTFLALVLLGASTSHTFLTFFKVFVLTVIFGLFHGLLLFPVILSVAGPAQQDKHQGSDADRNSTNSDNISEPPGFDNKAFQQEDLKKQDKLEASWTFSGLGFSKKGSWSPCSNHV